MIKLLAFLYFSYVLSYKLPDSIKLCHISQKDFNECVAQAMNDGVGQFVQGNKELGLPVLDPYLIEKLEIPPTAGKSLSIHQIFSNIKVIGMPTGKIKHLELNLDKSCGWTMDTFTPVISFVGDYKIDGKILVFPINSQGKCNVSQIALRNKHRMWCEKYQKNGKTFVRLTNYTMDMHPENMISDFSDIFPADKNIEKEISKTLNENGLALFNDIKGAFEQAFSMIYIQLANKVFGKIPFDEVFLP